MKIAIHSVLVISCIILDILFRTCVLSFLAGSLFFKTILLIKEYYVNKASRTMWAKFQNNLKDKVSK